MQVFKNHIAVALLAGFLFPQIAGSMHFWVVPHSNSYEKETTVTISDLNNQFHSCHYHLTGFSSFLASEGDHSNIAFAIVSVAENFRSLENYIQYPKYNFQLRGPPFV